MVGCGVVVVVGDLLGHLQQLCVLKWVERQQNSSMSTSTTRPAWLKNCQRDFILLNSIWRLLSSQLSVSLCLWLSLSPHFTSADDVAAMYSVDSGDECWTDRARCQTECSRLAALRLSSDSRTPPCPPCRRAETGPCFSTRLILRVAKLQEFIRSWGLVGVLLLLLLASLMLWRWQRCRPCPKTFKGNPQDKV